MRLVEGPRACAAKLVCPYHAWTYDLDGRLTGVPFRRDYPALRLEDNGLVAVDIEVWRGFVFVRLEDRGGPSVAAMMAPYDAEISPYRLEPTSGRSARSASGARAVNWKNVGDNYSDNLHIPVAHDGLSRLFGKQLRDRSQRRGPTAWSATSPTAGRRIASERFYQHASAGRRPPAADPSAPLAVFQAVAEHGVRPLPRPDRFHAVAPRRARRRACCAKWPSPCPTAGAR